MPLTKKLRAQRATMERSLEQAEVTLGRYYHDSYPLDYKNRDAAIRHQKEIIETIKIRIDELESPRELFDAH